jgi:hypothetical protein
VTLYLKLQILIRNEMIKVFLLAAADEVMISDGHLTGISDVRKIMPDGYLTGVSDSRDAKN